jgi:hypothetical protein
MECHNKPKVSCGKPAVTSKIVPFSQSKKEFVDNIFTTLKFHERRKSGGKKGAARLMVIRL